MCDIHDTCGSVCSGNKDSLKAFRPILVDCDELGVAPGLTENSKWTKGHRTSKQGGVVVLVMPVVMPCVAILIHQAVQRKHTRVRQHWCQWYCFSCHCPTLKAQKTCLFPQCLTMSNVVLHQHRRFCVSCKTWWVVWLLSISLIKPHPHRLN